MDGEEAFEDVEKRLQTEDATSESIEYAKSHTPRSSKHRAYDANADRSGGEKESAADPSPPRPAGRHSDSHGGRKLSEEFHYKVRGGGAAEAEQMSDTMLQIEALNRQLAELTRSGDGRHHHHHYHPLASSLRPAPSAPLQMRRHSARSRASPRALSRPSAGCPIRRHPPDAGRWSGGLSCNL